MITKLLFNVVLTIQSNIFNVIKVDDYKDMLIMNISNIGYN